MIDNMMAVFALYSRMVDQTLLEHRAAEESADEGCHPRRHRR
jgi:hypothetical protein